MSKFGDFSFITVCRKEVDSPWSWLVCICATVIVALFFGVSLSFGVMFPVLMEYFQTTRERTAWVGSVGIAGTFMLGPLSSVVINRLGVRLAAFLGGLICVASLLLSSLPSHLPLLFLTYSFPFGFGSSCLFVSCYVIISQYFEKKRALATGIVASGTGVGVFAVAPICQSLLDAFDWRNTYRITAGYFSVVCILCLTFVPPMRKKADSSTDVADNEVELPDEMPSADKPKKLLNFSIFKNKVYTVVTLSLTIAFLGHHTPRLHLVKFSEELSVSADAAAQLFIYIGITTFIGRMLSGILNNISCVNPIFVYMFGLILDGSCVIILSLAKNYIYLVAFSILYGIADGLVIGSFNFIILNCVEPSKRASAFGVGGLFYGSTLAGGSPLAGFMTDRLHTYKPSFFLSAAVEFVGAVILLCVICDHRQGFHRQPVHQKVTLGDDDCKLDDTKV
ncbi:monocarboxylate transporter 3-like isoform X1 [Acropora muricata]|uniref:monocarboxylate transporter 3-like isoform X1 n=3 Tax=Acropora muricata TaxID=159855 RepID=UPI0034E43B5D